MHEDFTGHWVLIPRSRRGLNPNELTVAEILNTKGYATVSVDAPIQIEIFTEKSVYSPVETVHMIGHVDGMSEVTPYTLRVFESFGQEIHSQSSTAPNNINFEFKYLIVKNKPIAARCYI